MTILELMIVIAIIGVSMVVLRSGFRALTRADLSEDATELAGFLRRVSLLAIETGEQHRVVMDLGTGNYVAEVCQGQAALARNAELRVDEDQAKRALERGKDKLRDVPEDALAVGDPDEVTRRALAIAGHHIADRRCMPVEKFASGYMPKHTADDKQDWSRRLDVDSNIKFQEIWVQHRDDSTTKGQVAVHFFPNGSSEKAVIELTDGDATYSILIHSLTGRVQLKSGKLDDVDEHMLRNALGNREKERETE